MPVKWISPKTAALILKQDISILYRLVRAGRIKAKRLPLTSHYFKYQKLKSMKRDLRRVLVDSFSVDKFVSDRLEKIQRRQRSKKKYREGVDKRRGERQKQRALHRATIKRLIRQGLTVTEIACKLQFCAMTIYRYMGRGSR